MKFFAALAAEIWAKTETFEADLESLLVSDSSPGSHMKTDMEPENEDLEDEFPFEKGDFQVPC